MNIPVGMMRPQNGRGDATNFPVSEVPMNIPAPGMMRPQNGRGDATNPPVSPPVSHMGVGMARPQDGGGGMGGMMRPQNGRGDTTNPPVSHMGFGMARTQNGQGGADMTEETGFGMARPQNGRGGVQQVPEPMMRMARPQNGRGGFQQVQPRPMMRMVCLQNGRGDESTSATTDFQPAVFAPPPPPTVRHTGVVCDNCGAADFQGPRYKCMQRADHDLCSSCYEQGANAPARTSADTPIGHPSGHYYVRIDVPRSNSANQASWSVLGNRTAVVHGASCSCCIAASPIVGTRYQCVVCQVDICESCEFSGRHAPEHPRMKFTVAPTPVPRPVVNEICTATR
jgi:hypothetical protein